MTEPKTTIDPSREEVVTTITNSYLMRVITVAKEAENEERVARDVYSSSKVTENETALREAHIRTEIIKNMMMYEIGHWHPELRNARFEIRAGFKIVVPKTKDTKPIDAMPSHQIKGTRATMAIALIS